MLSSNDLARMRTTAGAALPDTCVVQSQTFVSDNGGGGSASLVASGTFDCRLAPLLGFGNQEGQTGERIAAESNFIVTLPFDAGVTTEKQLVINGGTFNVEMVRTRSWPLTQRVEVSRYS